MVGSSRAGPHQIQWEGTGGKSGQAEGSLESCLSHSSGPLPASLRWGLGEGCSNTEARGAVQSQPRGPWRKDEAVWRRQGCRSDWQPQGEAALEGIWEARLRRCGEGLWSRGRRVRPQGRIVYKHLRPF